MTRSMFDAAYRPASPPPTDAAAFYIGGNAIHIWTDAEIASLTARWRLPIFVRPYPNHDPIADADFCAQWAAGHGQPTGTVIALDLETLVDAGYVLAFDARLASHGYLTLEYGSDAYIFSNPVTSGGRWGAHYGIGPQIEAGEVATQYADDRELGKPWDLSLVADSVPLWDTHPAPIPPLPLEDLVQTTLFGWVNPDPIANPNKLRCVYITDGFRYREIHDPVELAGVIGVMTRSTGHAPIIEGGPTYPSVAVIREWGNPDDAETARIAGVPFP